MHEAFWNGLYDARWEHAPLGAEAIGLVIWLRKRGYGEKSRRTYAHAVVHLGRVLHAERAPCCPVPRSSPRLIPAIFPDREAGIGRCAESHLVLRPVQG